jgi:hypothetical protein
MAIGDKGREVEAKSTTFGLMVPLRLQPNRWKPSIRVASLRESP